MRRVSKAVAVASLLVALTTSNIYAIPSRGGSEPSLGSRIVKIVKIVRQIIGLDELSWPHP
ncbi:MAG TPA: hypothetical protein VGA84_00650 [Thermoanaerobaculia bacterium]